MKRLIASLICVIAVSGCTHLFNDESVAGGGCERKSTYGIEFMIAGIGGTFALAANCEETDDDTDSE